jgi:virulence-associated protein VapD
LIKDIQNLFTDHGFEMSMNKVLIKERGVIKLKKYFSLEEVGKGIYFDKKTRELAYFRLPHKIEWDLFEEITRRISVNVALGEFDTALGAFHIGEKTEYIIRVLKLQRSLDSIELIKQDYLNFIIKPELLNLNAL